MRFTRSAQVNSLDESVEHSSDHLDFFRHLQCLMVIEWVKTTRQPNQDFDLGSGTCGDPEETFEVAVRSAPKSFGDVRRHRYRSPFDLGPQTEPLGRGQTSRKAIRLSR